MSHRVSWICGEDLHGVIFHDFSDCTYLLTDERGIRPTEQESLCEFQESTLIICKDMFKAVAWLS